MNQIFGIWYETDLLFNVTFLLLHNYAQQENELWNVKLTLLIAVSEGSC